MGLNFWPMFKELFAKNRSKEKKRQLQGIDSSKLPVHIAIIMDGNGRWAKNRGLPRAAGHRAGVEALRDIVEACSQWGIKILTVYAFSTENWKRPQEEVDTLMKLLTEYLRKESLRLHRNNIKICPIGRIHELPLPARKEIEKAVRLTENNTGLILNIALNYGGRAEIVDATRSIVRKVLAGNLQLEDINEDVLNNHLYTSSLPDPDLLIRPSGELRVSNFLLWQIAYTEFWFTDVLWPEFNREHLYLALEHYANRERRFGGIKI